MNLHDANSSHFDDILRLNESAIPHVNRIGSSELQELFEQSCFFKIALIEDRVAGFLLALAEGQAYASVNYRWFAREYDRFVYVDRIVVGEDYKGQGIGRQLYSELEALAFGRADVLTCEVNLEPPNPQSLAFHQRLGFGEVGRQASEGGTKQVCLMAKTSSKSKTSGAIETSHP